MSKIVDCPQCGEHNCVSDKTDLNYCMWCGYSFRDNKELGELLIDSTSGQTYLFNTEMYKSQKAWHG